MSNEKKIEVGSPEYEAIKKEAYSGLWEMAKVIQSMPKEEVIQLWNTPKKGKKSKAK